MYAFERLNRIYEAGLGLHELRALHLLKSISASPRYFYQSCHAKCWNQTWISNLPNKGKDYDYDRLQAIRNWEGDKNSPHILMIPTASSAIFDPARFVGVVRAHLTNHAFTVIPNIHKDWSWIVHLDRDSPNGLKDDTRR